MTDEQFVQYIEMNRELRGVEFKGAGSRNDIVLATKVAKAALGMANRRDGGYVIIGVDEKDGLFTPIGLNQQQLKSWQHFDNTEALLNSFADPHIRFDIEVKEYDNKQFIVLTVYGFDDVPVICKKRMKDPNIKDPNIPPITREGACYVRPRRRNETTEVSTSVDMRDLIDLAVEKRLQRFVAQIRTVGIDLSKDVEDHEQQFQKEITKINDTSLDQFKVRGYWEVIVRPATYDAKGVKKFSDLLLILERSVVDFRGWDFPYVDDRKDLVKGVDWVGQDNNIHDMECWRFFLSGQFIDIFGFEDDWWGEYATVVDSNWEPGKSLSIEAIVYRFTEIFKFSERLVTDERYPQCPEYYIGVTLHRLKDRKLYFDNPHRRKRGEHKANIDVFPFSQVVNRDTLISSSLKLASDAASEVLQRFGWAPSEELLQDIQRGIVR